MPAKRKLRTWCKVGENGMPPPQESLGALAECPQESRDWAGGSDSDKAHHAGWECAAVTPLFSFRGTLLQMKIGINSGLPLTFTVSAASSSCPSLLPPSRHFFIKSVTLRWWGLNSSCFPLPPGILPIMSYLTLPTGFPTEPQA